jgi:hypothetical protein
LLLITLQGLKVETIILVVEYNGGTGTKMRGFQKMKRI